MRFRPSLITKLTLSTSLVLLCFMVLLAYINSQNFKNVITDYTVSNADQLAEIITQSAYNSMLKNDKAGLSGLIWQIGLSEGVTHIRLMDRTGKIIHSSSEDEIGKVIDKNAEACTMCHKTDNPRLDAPTMHRSRFFIDSDGKRVMGLTKAIYNEPACYNASCHVHSSSHAILGVLDIVIPLDKLNNKISEYRTQIIVLTSSFILILGALITLLTQVFVNLPVQRLAKHSAMISSGNLDVRVPVTSNDELGELSESFNQMTEDLRKAHMELEAWGARLEAKVDERTGEIKRIETQLFRSEKLASLGKLVAGIAHEINNPLTGVLLYSSIINSDNRLHEDLRPDVDRIIKESRRCAEIVSQLLEFSREAMPHKEAVSLNELVEQVIAMLHKQPSFHDITIVKEFDRTLPDVLIDPGQIQQVFINLFLNATQAMQEGGILTITTRLDEQEFLACADVMDNGCGMSEEDIGMVFDPFFTTKPDGTGLGLSISYGIIENNGGEICVASKLGEGTVFTVKFPVYVGPTLKEC
jgi:two-component system NtrC family sensor kinase